MAGAGSLVVALFAEGGGVGASVFLGVSGESSVLGVLGGVLMPLRPPIESGAPAIHCELGVKCMNECERVCTWNFEVGW